MRSSLAERSSAHHLLVKRLSHLDKKGRATMVDISPKLPQYRRAVAKGEIRCAPATIKLLRQGKTPKGDVLAVARVAGIQAAKQTANLIPLCHPLPIDSIHLELAPRSDRIQICAEVRVHARTGVEMEALTAVSVAALTLYDMLKAVDRKMVIQNIHLHSKEKF
jgi:cyclic pyranopterin phosphate synthase